LIKGKIENSGHLAIIDEFLARPGVETATQVIPATSDGAQRE
jgi:hypothetical protein